MLFTFSLLQPKELVEVVKDRFSYILLDGHTMQHILPFSSESDVTVHHSMGSLKQSCHESHLAYKELNK